ncbi:L-glutamate gamma-semialdehyde dehydrogenase, partial [Singulisphaera rosea]
MGSVMVDRTTSQTALDRRAQEIGRDLFARIGRGSAPWERGWWDDRLMNLTLDDPAVKVQLFRFIDAMPALKDAGTIRRHLAEYLGEAGTNVPGWLRLAVGLAPEGTPG